MKNVLSSLLTISCGAALLFSAMSAEASSKTRTTTHANGSTRTVDSGYTPGSGAHRDVTDTTASGKTLSRSNAVTSNGNGGYSSTHTATGLNGKTTSTSVNGQVTANGSTRNVSHTGVNGNSSSKTVTRTH